MKKRGKMSLTITIGIACFILVMIMFMQFKVVYETDISSIETMREEDLKKELASWKLKYDDIEAKYKEIEATLKKYNEETQFLVITNRNGTMEAEDTVY